MNTPNTLTKSPTVPEFLDALNKWQADFIAGAEPVAKMLVAALDVNPGFARECEAAGVPRSILHRLERLGRGQIVPRLLEDNSCAARYLLKLPKSEQQIAYARGVEVMEPDGATDAQARLIKIDELTPAQAAQVFNCDHIRTLAEQRTYIATKKAKSPRVTMEATHRVKKDGVEILRAGFYGKAILLQWLSEIG